MITLLILFILCACRLSGKISQQEEQNLINLKKGD